MTSLYGEVERITRRAVREPAANLLDLDQRIDRIVTSRAFGLPLMLAILAVVFWLTITGANVPSQMLATALFWFEDLAAARVRRRSARRGGSPGSSGTACIAAWPGSSA